MTTIYGTTFEQIIERSDYQEDFYKGLPIHKKYWKFLPPLDKLRLQKLKQSLPKGLKVDNINYGKQRSTGTVSQLEKIKHDINKSFDMTLVNESQYKDAYKWACEYPLEKPLVQIHNQKPGQMHPLHFDTIGSYSKLIPDADERIKKVRKVFIFLEDHAPGQIVMMGRSTYLYKWSAGDVLWFDWYHCPHATANFGRNTRMLFQITGTTTSEFEKLIAYND
mgnify:CR=1 FL=1